MNFKETIEKLSNCSVTQISQLIDLNQLSITRKMNETQESLIKQMRKLQNSSKKFKIYPDLLSENKVSLSEVNDTLFEIVPRQEVVDKNIANLEKKIDFLSQKLDSQKRPREFETVSLKIKIGKTNRYQNLQKKRQI